MKRLLVLSGTTLFLVECGGPHTLSSNEHRNAVSAAREFAGNIKGTFISCSAQDSQNIGYTTCTIADAAGSINELRCTYQDEAVGCKFTPR